MNIEFKLPELGENISSGDVVRVMVHEGDVIVGNQGVIELETDKAGSGNSLPPCRQGLQTVREQRSDGQSRSARAQYRSRNSGDDRGATAVPRGGTAGGKATSGCRASGTVSSSVASPAGPDRRSRGRELGVDLAAVAGTGRGGRITAEDVEPRPAV